MVIDRLRNALTAGRGERTPPLLSFGSWEALAPGQVVQVCHPEWRGIKAATYAFGGQVVECDDLAEWGSELVSEIRAREPSCVVIQGWPPGADVFIRQAALSGLKVKAVLHSSPALQGELAAEAAVVTEALNLSREGVLSGLAMDKAGVTEAFGRLGHSVTHVPNRPSDLSQIVPRDLGPGFHVGVFGEPWWPKNILTQVLAAGLIEDSVVHVSRPLRTPYLDHASHRVHEDLARSEFLGLLGSVALNLNVSLTECHPMLPMESYLLGVPCLVSRTSHLFKSDPILWGLTTVSEHDNPASIAEAAVRLARERHEAVVRASAWITAADREAEETWEAFVGL